MMCGSPFFGYIVQRFGVRMSLFICYGSTMLSGVLLFFSNDLSTVFLSRIPCIFMHGQQGHQTLLSALTSPGKERTNAFGRMGLTFGLGFVITPIFCIIFTKLFSESAPIIASAVFCVLPFLVLECCLDRRSYEEHQSEVAIESETNMSITNVVRILNRPGVLNVMFKKNAPIVPMLLIFSIMHLYLLEEFKSDAQTGQLIQMMTGICIMCSNGFGVIWMRRRFSEQTLLFIGMIFFTISFVMFFFFYRLWMIIIIMPFISFGMSLVATVADSLLTALVAENEQGLVLGVATSFNSFSLGLSDEKNGYLQTFFALLQLCGGILFGFIVQKHGIHCSLKVSYVCTALSGVLLFFSRDLKTVLLSRIPCILMQGQQGHQILISSLTVSGQERTNAFGRMGFVHGLALIVTPIFSIVSAFAFSESAPLITSAAVSVLTLFFHEILQEKKLLEERECVIDTVSNTGFSDIVKVLKRPAVLNVLFKKNAPLISMTLLFSILQALIRLRVPNDRSPFSSPIMWMRAAGSQPGYNTRTLYLKALRGNRNDMTVTNSYAFDLRGSRRKYDELDVLKNDTVKKD
ncbi:hypothetical protein RB195_002823 [Necator americanus]|uniref:Transporter, major facilitator family protein n=1 Tax=Necator americanus TaxID=51031 RepID=A0ABR1DKU9_NECAM